MKKLKKNYETRSTFSSGATIVLAFILVIVIFIALYLQLPMFGQLPCGERLAKIEKSRDYKNGEFRNISETPIIVGNPVKVIAEFLKRYSKKQKPPVSLPVIKTDLKNLPLQENILVWFGHSSCFIQLDGRRILVDPLFSKVSSPLLFFPKAFDKTDLYKADDMPEIDYLVITHDHWDHLDYKTVLQLKFKTKHVVCPLGVGAHFEYWGFDKEQIIEMDWNDNIQLADDFTIYCLPARHFSGRGIFFNKSLWASFLLKTKTFKVYISGDSGYDGHYAEIGKKFGPIDLVLLDSGHHNKNWKYVHMMTEEVIKASRDLHAKMLMPIHICKFSLANYAWNEPLVELSQMIAKENFSILTPIIGEKVNLQSMDHGAHQWWEDF